MIELPWPPSKLSPNTAGHWRTKETARKKYISDCHYITCVIPKITHVDNVPIEIIFYPPDKRKRDLDNLLANIKYALDPLAKNLGINDTRFRPITIDFGPVHKGGKIVIKLS